MVAPHDFEEEKLQEPFSYDDLSCREVRSLIFHLLYAMEAFNYKVSLDSIVDNFNRGFDLDIPLDGKLVDIARQVIDQREQLDEKVRPLLINWRFERIGVCTKLVLRLAVWEFLNTDIPSNVIINEAIELAKCFSETDSYKFVNGILDEFAKSCERKEEAVKK